jgi:hypothetical protein
VIIPQDQFDLIASSKIRRRYLELPVRGVSMRKPRHPKTGRVLRMAGAASGVAVARCPMRKGGTYRLRGPVPYTGYRDEADDQPTRARAVLALYDLCHLPAKTETVTVTSVERQGETWLIRFRKGELDLLDRPVFLARQGDYTTIASRQAVPGDPEVMMQFAEDLQEARKKARERRLTPQQEGLAKVRAEVETCRGVMTTMKAKTRLRLILKELEKLEAEVAAESSAILPASQCAESQVSAEANGEPRPTGSESVVSLESAA